MPPLNRSWTDLKEADERHSEVTWYYPLEGDLRKCQTAWDVVICLGMTRFGIFMTLIILWVLETLRIVPAGTYEVEEALKKAGLALVAGGQQKLFTPMMVRFHAPSAVSER